MSPRRYEAPRRAEAAAETRARILEAVYDLMRKEPTKPISLDRIARRAGVARSTIYLIFASRSGLFEALAEDLAHRSGLAKLTEAVAHPDARQHLRGGFSAGIDMFLSDPDIQRTLFSMARLDPESLGVTVAKMDGNRAGGMIHLANRLAEQGVLRPDVTRQEAADLLWVLTSFDTFDLLKSRGLSVRRIKRLLTAAAERAVCIPEDEMPPG